MSNPSPFWRIALGLGLLVVATQAGSTAFLCWRLDRGLDDLSVNLAANRPPGGMMGGKGMRRGPGGEGGPVDGMGPLQAGFAQGMGGPRERPGELPPGPGEGDGAVPNPVERLDAKLSTQLRQAAAAHSLDPEPLLPDEALRKAAVASGDIESAEVKDLIAAYAAALQKLEAE